MKKNNIGIFLALVICTQCLGQSWTQLNSPIGSPYQFNCVSFLNCQQGAAGGGGSNGSEDIPLAAYTPDGTHWANSGVPNLAFSEMGTIQYVTPTTIYSAVSSGIEGWFCRSVDGGQTFTDSLFPILGGPGAYQYFAPTTMHFFDSLTGYIAGAYYTSGACNCHSWQVIKTTDGGKTWEQTAENHPYRLNQNVQSISFPNIYTGFVLTDYDSLFTTADSGHTWAMIHAFNTGLTPNSIYFQNPDTGWASCGGGNLLKTMDGGHTWITVSTFTTFGFGKIIFTDANNMWLLAGSNILHNKNGGSNFLTQTDTFSFSNSISDFCMLSNSLGYAVGGSAIYEYSGPLDTNHVTRSVCSGQSVSIAGQVFNATGNYSVTLVGSGGCDSAAVALNLTVYPPVNPMVANNGGVLSTGSFSSYQWLYNGAPVTNAVGQTFRPPFVGNYSVVVTDANGCIDTSASLLVSTVGIAHVSISQISLFPNPAKDYVQLSLASHFNGEVIVCDVTGREVMAFEMNDTQVTMNVSKLSPGLYIVTLQNSSERFSGKIVKE